MKKIPFLSFFGMTKELTALSSYISITDDRAAVIENCKQIVECSEIMAKVLTGSFEIEIWGSGLTMSNFCSDSVEITSKSSLCQEVSGREDNDFRLYRLRYHRGQLHQVFPQDNVKKASS